MSEGRRHPLAAIELGILQDEPIASLLRKVIILGGQTGAPELRSWASAELNGYPGEVDVPEYRQLAAGFAVDGIAGYTVYKQLPVSPVVVSSHLGRDVTRLELRQPIAELGQLAQSSGESVKFSPAWAPLVIAELDRGEMFQQTHSLYWQVHASTIAGVIDRVTTKLADFVAEVRSLMPSDAEEPSGEAVRTATIVITGGINQVTLGANSPAGHVTVSIGTGDADALRRELHRLGVDDTEWEELQEAMSADEETSSRPVTSLGQRTKATIARVALRLGRASGSVAVGATGGALGDLLTEAVKAYYGLH